MAMHIARIVAASTLLLASGVGSGLVGCKGTTTPAERKSGPSIEELEGGRETSPNRRASDERPRPWADEKGPFDSERMGIEAHRVRKQEAESKRSRSRATPTADGGSGAPP